MRLIIRTLVVAACAYGALACSDGGSDGGLASNVTMTGNAGTSTTVTPGAAGTPGAVSTTGGMGTTVITPSTAGMGQVASGGMGNVVTPMAGGSSVSMGGTPAGTAGMAATNGGAGASMAGAGAGGAGAMGDDITATWASTGCGQNPPPSGMTLTIDTSGTKPADCADQTCGDWQSTREYTIFLPQGYDNTRPYILVFMGPGCGGRSQDIYPYNNNADGNIIRVGLRPSENIQAVHATNPNQGCFDDKEGDDSVDWVLYEDLYDLLETQLCFDRNRVFAGGNSSGSWFSNELGCKYAGDPMRPVRGVMPNTGGLPDQPEYKPTCTTEPMSGMWIHETGDTTNGFAGNKYAIARAMAVNGCTIGNSYDNTMFEDYPIGGGQADNVCRKILGCPDLYPLIVCPLNGNGHGSHDDVVNPGVSTYLQSFLAPPLAP